MLGAFVVFITPRRGDTEALQDKIKDLRRSIKAEEKRADSLSNIASGLEKETVVLSKKYDSVWAVAKNLSKYADSLQKEEIRKGKIRYGERRPLRQDVSASLYGNQAFDELFITDKRIGIQTKIIGIQKGIKKSQFKIDSLQVRLIKKAKKIAAKKSLSGFLKGTVVGVLLSLLLLL